MACGDTPECCIRIAVTVDPTCCGGDFWCRDRNGDLILDRYGEPMLQESHVDVELFTRPPGVNVIDTATGNIVPTGIVWTGTLAENGCVTTCDLPVNSAHTATTAYRVTATLKGRRVYVSPELYIDAAVVTCGETYDIQDLITLLGA